MIIKGLNLYDKYYNQRFLENQNIIINHHEEFLVDENENKNNNDYYFNYLIDREKIYEEVINRKKITKMNNDGVYSFFNEEIFIEIFKELKKKWKNLKVTYFKKTKITLKYDESFIYFNNSPNIGCVEIYWGGIVPIPNVCDFFKKKLDNNEKFMLCRIGIVELDIIHQYKYNKNKMLNVYEKYKNMMCDHNSNDIFDLKDKNVIKDKLIYDLLRVSTNAGFYITEKENNFSILEYFIQNYLDAYNNCNGLFRCDGCLNIMLNLNERFVPNYTINIEKDIYNLINNKKILIVSPFADQINYQVKSGNIHNLFKKKCNIIINSVIVAIETPITIFGNPVDNSWKDTFNKTCKKIKDYCNKNNIDIVIPSCGSYSMPICNYVYKELNISTLCFGNAIHQLFGIMQNDFYAFSRKDINEEYWIKIDKSVIRNERLMENMKKIDITGGKYVNNLYNFKCIITGKHVSLSESDAWISREGMEFDGCTSRLRAMIYLLSKQLFDKPTCLIDFPINKNIKGIGMSDAPEYAIPLSEKLDYTNTYYEKEPFLDIYKLTEKQKNSYDFVLTTDVFEHIPPHPGLNIAFKNLYDLLKPNGFVIFGVPFSLDEKTIEHFPNLYNFHFTTENKIILHNQTINNVYEKFEDLCFHGGPGDITQNKGNGSTLEMRIFCKKDLVKRFYSAGFREIEFLNIEDPIIKNYGIYWEGPWSLCMIVRK